jgi:predicted O-methyltransferase YrrM
LKHRKRAVNEHGLHSPFVYNLYLHAVKNTKTLSVVDLSTAAAQLGWRGKQVFLEDFGTGKNREIDLYRWGKRAVSNRRKLQVLSGLASYFEPGRILEMGTALGLSSLALKMAMPATEVNSWEGSQILAEEAKRLWEKYRSDILLEVGSFDQIAKEPRGQKNFDLVFVDGDHKGEQMVKWVSHFYAKNPDTVFIIDDIHWSIDMERAWENLTTDDRWNLSADFYYFGLLAPRREQVKEHFVLKI